jgi:hypothetical protein
MLVAGYPCSGQYYVRSFASIIFDLPLGFSSHRLSEIKEAVSNQQKVFIVVRNPLDAVSSWVNKRTIWPESSQNVTPDLDFWIRYHEYVLENRDTLILLDFNKLTTDVNYLVDMFAENGFLTKNDISDEDIRQFMIENDLGESNLPNVKRYTHRAQIVEKVSSEPRLDEAKTLYGSLLKG